MKLPLRSLVACAVLGLVCHAAERPSIGLTNHDDGTLASLASDAKERIRALLRGE